MPEEVHCHTRRDLNGDINLFLFAVSCLLGMSANFPHCLEDLVLLGRKGHYFQDMALCGTSHFAQKQMLHMCRIRLTNIYS